MSIHQIPTLDKIAQVLGGLPVIKTKRPRDFGPDDFYPNFKFNTASGEVDFWQWAEGYWVYVTGLPSSISASIDQLLSFAFAADALRESNIKLLGVSPIDKLRLDQLSDDVSALAGKPLEATLVADPNGRLADHLTLRVNRSFDGTSVRQSFLIEPNLQIARVSVATDASVTGAEEILSMVNAARRLSAGTHPKYADFDDWEAQVAT